MTLMPEKQPHWLDRRLFSSPSITLEQFLYMVIIALALFSRLYILGARVMSHDENSHVYYSWRFAQGMGFSHDPLMHGPLQFHLLALSYFMFGDNDFTARLPAALFSVAAVGFLWFYRRDLGRTGALVGAVMMLISPYMSYYGRYARNEGLIELFGVVTIWALLRYLESGLPKYLYWLTVATVLHFTSKETSFIYTAQAMLFLGGYFLYRVTQVRWPEERYRPRFVLAVMAALVLLGALGGYLALVRSNNGGEIGAPDLSPSPLTQSAIATAPAPLTAVLLALFGLTVAMGLYFLARGYTLEALRADRPLSALILLGTLVLPQLAAFPMHWLGWKIPTNANEVLALTLADTLRIGALVVPLAVLSAVIGLFWNPRQWLINAAIWYGIFTVFYTSLFTNGAGFFTGLVGSLGYWLEQQGVQRGNQPWYYYALIQVPLYEYLAALGTWLAFGYAAHDLWRRSRRSAEGDAERELAYAEGLQEFTRSKEDEEYGAETFTGQGGTLGTKALSGEEELRWALPRTREAPSEMVSPPVFPLLGFWAVSSLIAFTLAGEKMPWLTVHIALPAILCSGWAYGRLIDGSDWSLLRQRHGWLLLLLIPFFLLSALAALGSLLGPNPPFQGQQLAQLQATGQFLTSFLAALLSGVGLLMLVKRWEVGQLVRLLALAGIGLLALLTARTSIQANFYNYDNANELLVYAHSAPGVKIALQQIEEISLRTTNGLAIRVAYDNETSYPYWWYLRNYPNAQYYGATPSRALREVPIILVGDANFGKIEPIVANLYDRFDYIRLWWPNQDYFDLTWERVRNALTDPAMRQALFEIWLNRDYTTYGKVLKRDFSLHNWSPSARMRLYIRKDITGQLWNYGSAPAAITEPGDPFEGRYVTLSAVQVIGTQGMAPGQFQRPRDIAIAPDGTLYVADTENHRIQHLSPEGEVLHVWGGFGDATRTAAPGGLFNQPWGIGLGPDGSVYVADTWNHRVQKFTAEGEFVTMWGYFGQGEQPEAFWGPRDVAVDSKGRVFVTDTGNKRVVVFDGEGRYITQFGGPGLAPGQLDEPVGIVIDANGLIYVADTWNQRIQVFQEGEETNLFRSFRTWELQAWYGQSLDNKPYLAVDERGFVFAVDPEGYRVLQFTLTGEAVRAWGDYGVSSSTFGLPASVAVAPDGGIWVVDAGNSRLMLFRLP